MTCISCGSDNPEGAVFCTHCGAELVERTQEFALPDLGEYTPPPLRMRPVIRVAAKTDMGRVRENNEDKFEYYQPDKPPVVAARGSAFVVCDGMGGHAAGQIASEIAAKTFLDIYYRSSAAYFPDAATAGVSEANRYVADVAKTIPDRHGMGTTLTGLIICQDQALAVHVGDSRMYRLSGSEFGMVTTDQTWVEEQVASGAMTHEEAMHSPYAHVITNAVGMMTTTKPDLIPIEPKVGDRYLLCSDGLTNHVKDNEIRDHLMEYGPSDACWRLVNLALDRGGSDNCTVLVAELTDLIPADTQSEV